MKRFLLISILLLSLCHVQAQFTGPFRNTFYDPDSLPKPFKALGMSLIPDVTVFSINRFVKHSDFAYIDWKSTYDNFMFTSLWDNDMFGTNLLAHPFHGSMDYNGARVSGMNYWQCFPYVFGASAVWEFILENEPASFNDQLATSFGGMVLGEASFRISNMILDNESRGLERAVREFFGALTCPLNGVNRLFTGQMWKYKRYRSPSPNEIIPIDFGVDLAARYLSRFGGSSGHNWSPYVHGWLVYGDPFRKENMRPLDYFRFEVSLDLMARKAILTAVEVVGLLWGKEIPVSKDNQNLMWGIFQHFQYKEKEEVGPDSIPSMRYSEPASVGVGMEYKSYNSRTKNTFSGCFHLNGVLLGAAQASEFKLKGRDYNFGQGYSIKMNLRYNIKKKLELGMNSMFTQLFTWKGYPEGIIIEQQDPRTLNAMGDRGNTIVTIIRPYLQWNLFKHFSLNLSGNLFLQFNHNYQFENKHYYFHETNLGIKYSY